MAEKLSIEQKHWKKYKEKRGNGLILAMYCVIFAGMGAVLLLGVQRFHYHLFRTSYVEFPYILQASYLPSRCSRPRTGFRGMI